MFLRFSLRKNKTSKARSREGYYKLLKNNKTLNIKLSKLNKSLTNLNNKMNNFCAETHRNNLDLDIPKEVRLIKLDIVSIFMELHYQNERNIKQFVHFDNELVNMMIFLQNEIKNEVLNLNKEISDIPTMERSSKDK